MKRTNLAFCCSTFLFAGLSVVRADVSGVPLFRQASSGVIDGIADLTHGSIRWSNGAFLYEDTGVAGLPPVFYTLDRQGTLLASSKLDLPVSQSVWPGGLDRGADGTIVCSGGVYSAGGNDAPFLAWITPDGRTSKIVQTAPYLPYSLSIAPDGTVWTMGLEMINGDPKKAGLDPNAGVLRHFDKAGKLIESGIPQSEFTATKELYRVSSGFLVAKRDRIGWISYMHKGRDLIYKEISPETLKVERSVAGPSLDLAATNLIGNFTLTDRGNAFFSVSTRKQGYSNPSTYVLNRTTGNWSLVSIPTVGGSRSKPFLLGSDGEQIVFMNDDSAGFFSLIQ